MSVNNDNPTHPDLEKALRALLEKQTLPGEFDHAGLSTLLHLAARLGAMYERGLIADHLDLIASYTDEQPEARKLKSAAGAVRAQEYRGKPWT